jgi:short-subunit dehydrogenase
MKERKTYTMQNKIAVVTGATSGIGAAYAKRFASQGYDLVITGRRKEKIEAFAGDIRREHHVSVDVVLAELSEKEGIHKVIEQMQGKQIEILVNNAGFGISSLFQGCDLDNAEQLASVNVIAPMELIHAVLPEMVAKKSGTIINISSTSVYMIIARNAVYSGAKAFLKSFTEGLHLDLMGTGVKVQAVCPGLTRSDFHEKMGVKRSGNQKKSFARWMTPEEVVDCSLRDLKKNKVICIPGRQTKVITGVLGMLPKKNYYRTMYSISQKLAANRQ